MNTLKFWLVSGVLSAALWAAIILGVAYAQYGGYTPVNLSNAGPITYVSGGGGSATFGPGAYGNRSFRFKTSTTTDTGLVVAFGGGGYLGNPGSYIPACVATLETAAAGGILTVVPTATGVTLAWNTTHASVAGDVHCQ